MARPSGTRPVEVRLHGVVARLTEKAAPGVPGIVAVPAEAEIRLQRSTARTASRSAETEPMHSMGGGGRELSSSCPPGSTVSAERRGRVRSAAYAG